MTDERVDRGDEGAGEQAERLERERREMEERSGDLEREIGSTREEWESKKSGSIAPGAQEPPEDLDVSGAEPYDLSEDDRESSTDEDGDSDAHDDSDS